MAACRPKNKNTGSDISNDGTINVILISLKAGDMGLNGTATGYVSWLIHEGFGGGSTRHLTHPLHWQDTKNHCLKKICRDTMEEKILLQRTNLLTNELVSEDAGCMKKLTGNDIAFLFS